MSQEKVIHLQVVRPAARLDQYLATELPDLSRSKIKKLIKQNKILVSNHPVKPNAEIKPGDFIVVHLPASAPTVLLSEEIPLNIIFEDEELLVVNKPAGMVVHPAHSHSSGTLVNALLSRYPDLAALTQIDPDSLLRPGIVHRLDQDTSGLMVVARTERALRNLRQQFKARTVKKTYLALVFGQPNVPEGIIDVPLGRDLHYRQKIAPRADGKPARTHYRVQTSFDGYSLLEVGLETGRTHQIRVHLAWLKCPVVGDTVYGRSRNSLGVPRQFLHAWRLAFQHPRSGQRVQFEAPPDDDLQIILTGLGGSLNK